MEIDDKLKNRLAGTAVVTVLAIIFLPMLFDPPSEKKAQVVSELDIPKKPEVSPLLTTAIVPDKAAVVAPKPTAPSPSQATENVANKPEKSDVDAELANPAQDPEAAAQEDENPALTKKKSTKKTEDQELDSVAKKAEKPELPTLAESAADKKQAEKALPSLEAAPTASKRRWMIQVASLTDQTKANAFRDKLRSQGFPATVDSVWLKDKGRVYRLKVGPELDAEKAKSMKTKINQLNNVNSIAIAE